MEKVAWMEAFRARATGGIVPGSRFTKTKIVFPWLPRKIKPGKKGFWFLSHVSRDVFHVAEVNTEGHTIRSYSWKSGWKTRRDSEGNLLFFTDQQFFNLETEQEVTDSSTFLVPIPFTESVAVLNYGWISQYRCKSSPHCLLGNGSDAVFCSSGNKPSSILPGNEYRRISEIHYYKDELYHSSLWDPVKYKVFHVYPGEFVGKVRFSGMHSILPVLSVGLIFFYNLETKVFTGMNVISGVVLPAEDFFSDPSQVIPGDCRSSVSISTVGMSVYLLLQERSGLTLFKQV